MNHHDLFKVSPSESLLLGCVLKEYHDTREYAQRYREYAVRTGLFENFDAHTKRFVEFLEFRLGPFFPQPEWSNSDSHYSVPLLARIMQLLNELNLVAMSDFDLFKFPPSFADWEELRARCYGALDSQDADALESVFAPRGQDNLEGIETTIVKLVGYNECREPFMVGQLLGEVLAQYYIRELFYYEFPCDLFGP